ncbi:MAG: ABC transporter substrate-binding protein, partial [Candidatus Bipolaricaulia bacterium]
MKRSLIFTLLVGLALALASCGGPGTANVSISKAPKTIVAGGDYCFTVQNKLEKEASLKIELRVGGKVKASERVELGPGESKKLCFRGQFPQPGEYEVELAELKMKVTALAPEEALPISILEVTPQSEQVTANGVITYKLQVENNTDVEAKRTIAIRLDDQLIESREITLPPGEQRVVSFEFSQTDQPGGHRLQIGDQVREIEVLARPGELPPEPKVIGPEQGLTELGIPGGKIVVATTVGPKTLNHHIGQETSTTNVTGMLHAGLVEVNPITAEIEPALATHWEISSDKKEITFYLREGLKWSDGEPFTADDMAFTFNDILLNEDVNTDARDVLKVKGEYIKVEKVDDYTVKVITPEPFRPIFRIIGLAIMPQHKLAQHIAKLNPGARGSMRAAKNELDRQQEALQKLAPEIVAAIDAGLEDLSTAIDAQDKAEMEGVITALNQKLEELQAALPEE